jgi:hypothetical protein
MGVGRVSSRSQRVRAQLKSGILTLTCSWGPGALMGVQMKDQVSSRSQRVRAQLKADMDGPEAQMGLHMGGQVSSCSQRVRAQLKVDMDGPGEGPRPPEAVFEADTLMMMMQVGGTATIGETAKTVKISITIGYLLGHPLPGSRKWGH